MHTTLIYLGRRGAGRIISLELARRLQKHTALTVVISSFTEEKQLWRQTEWSLLEVETYQNTLSAVRSLFFRKQIRALARQIEAQKPAVLLFPMFHPWNFFLQRELPHIPAVVYVHDPRPHPDFWGWVFSKLETHSLRLAQYCIIMSATLEPFLEQRGIPKEKIEVIPLATLHYQSPPRVKEHASPRLLFIGRIVPYKGLEILLQAFRQVHTQFECTLTIVGEGNLRPYRKELAHLPDVEIINGWIPDTRLGAYFQQSDLLILPYTSASQSGIIPIAAAFALPVIATQTGGLPEQIDAGDSGWLVPPKDVAALATAMCEALSEPEEARKRGLALQKNYQTRFSWEQNAEKLWKSLKKAVQAGGRG